VVTSYRASRVALQLRSTLSHACAFAKKNLWQIKSGEWQNKIDCAQTNCPHTFYV